MGASSLIHPSDVCSAMSKEWYGDWLPWLSLKRSIININHSSFAQTISWFPLALDPIQESWNCEKNMRTLNDQLLNFDASRRARAPDPNHPGIGSGFQTWGYPPWLDGLEWEMPIQNGWWLGVPLWLRKCRYTQRWPTNLWREWTV